MSLIVLIFSYKSESFIVGEDGNAYEGRGWNRVGAHTPGYNAIGLGFCIIGNFMGTSRSPA